MPAVQIYQTINTLANNVGYTGQTVVDVTTFTAFAQAALTGLREGVYNQLYDMIGRTVIAIDEAKEDERQVVRQSHNNPQIIELYEKYLDEPNSHKAHKLLHTHYAAREGFNEVKK